MTTEEAKLSFDDRMRKRDEEIADAYAVVRGNLSAVLRRVKLLNPTMKITIKDVQRWRLGNRNEEKPPRQHNSWVGNYAKEEYQADLLFFDDLKEKIEVINKEGKKVKKKVSDKFDAGLLVVDSFSKKK
jgi:predicted kinase